MSDEEPARPTPSRPSQRRSQERAGVVVAVAAALIAASLLGGFIVGRATAPGPANRTESTACSSATSTLNKMLNVETPADETQESKNTRITTMSNVILQNPDCFDTETRATAQTFKDQVEADGQSAAVSDAADRVAECMTLVNIGTGC